MGQVFFLVGIGLPRTGLSRSPARYPRAILIARIYERFPLVCGHCGAEMRIVALITDTASVTRVLEHIGDPTKAPVLSPGGKRGQLRVNFC